MKVKNRVRPWLRYVRNTYQYRSALMRANLYSQSSNSPETSFVIGCGRSGTTILGKILGLHPRIYYLFEPWHLWAAVDSQLDLNNLHVRSEAKATVDESFYSEAAQRRFNRLFLSKVASEGKILVEKTPHNALRIRYLECLVPKARYVHIVRDGFEVVDSIDKLARDNSYKIATRGGYNQWWGDNFCKWHALKKDGMKLGYSEDEIASLQNHRQRAALEWVLSLLEVEKNEEALGDRYLEVKYHELVTSPHEVLSNIVQHLGLADDFKWLKEAVAMIRTDRLSKGEPNQLTLPPKLCADFNYFQTKYGFSYRAVQMKQRDN